MLVLVLLNSPQANIVGITTDYTVDVFSMCDQKKKCTRTLESILKNVKSMMQSRGGDSHNGRVE